MCQAAVLLVPPCFAIRRIALPVDHVPNSKAGACTSSLGRLYPEATETTRRGFRLKDRIVQRATRRELHVRLTAPCLCTREDVSENWSAGALPELHPRVLPCSTTYDNTHLPRQTRGIVSAGMRDATSNLVTCRFCTCRKPLKSHQPPLDGICLVQGKLPLC